MSVKHSLAITIIDKLFLAFFIFVLSITVVKAESGMLNMALDFIGVVFWVMVTYGGVWLAVNICTGWAAGFAKSQWMQLGLSILTFTFILYWFPLVLGVVFWLAGYEVGVNIADLLTWTFALRFAVRVYLERRWTT